MLIKCPKCHAVYDLPDHVMNNDGRKMRCAECHEIWIAHPEDAIKNSPKSKRADIQKMFERVSKETAPLFEEQPTKIVEKIRVVNVTHYKHTINFVLLLISLLSIFGIFYYMRYDVVRLFPQAEQIYDKMLVDSIPYGKNLEFQNITTREFTENNIAKIEISGIIVNTGKYQTIIPPLKIEIFDKSDKLLTEKPHRLPLQRLEAGYHILFNVVIVNPTPYGKSIYVKFADNQ